MIKLFIFDMGGVLVRNNNILPEAAVLLGLSNDKLFSYIEEDLTPLMQGVLSAESFWQNFSKKSGIPTAREFWGELYNPSIDEPTKKIINSLKNSFRVVCGSNTLSQHYEVHEVRGDFKNFDKVYASHLMGAAKPDLEFFQQILDCEGVRPEETVFIDDFTENIEAAVSMGINSFLFKDAVSLAAELKASGLGSGPVSD